MFTGIIQRQGRILDLKEEPTALKIRVASGFTDLEIGESVAVNGVCLTVTEQTADGEAYFFISPETLKRSNLGQITIQSFLNLERALTLQTRLSGHLVQGHVDGQARLLHIVQSAESYSLSFSIPHELARYCIEKGSIALNGVSLTINSIEDQPDRSATIQITVIPHTWQHTNLSQLSIGSSVNVEVDLLAKYMERLCRNSMKL